MVLELFSESAKNELTSEIIELLQALKRSVEAEEKDRWMKQYQACEYIKVSPAIFKKLRESGEIKPVHIDGYSINRYDRRLLDRFMESHQL